MNPFTGLSLESSCFNHLHKRIDLFLWNIDNHDRLYHSGTFIFIHRIYSSDQQLGNEGKLPTTHMVFTLR